MSGDRGTTFENFHNQRRLAIENWVKQKLDQPLALYSLSSLSIRDRDMLMRAIEISEEPIPVVQLQPESDSPGLFIGFATVEQRDQAMKLFKVVP